MKTETTTEKKHMLVLPYRSKKRRLHYQFYVKEVQKFIPQCIALT